MDLDKIFGKIAEQKIQEAIEEGAFDNLPGKGKPIVFDDDLITPPHMRLANKVLKNAGVLPDWMQVQKDLETERKEVVHYRERMLRENATRRARLGALPPDHPNVRAFAEWHARTRAGYLRRLKSVNTAVLKLSMMAPTTVQPPRPYRIEAEMESFDAAFLTLEQQPTVQVTEDDAGTLKNLTRAHYKEGNRGGALGHWIKTARMARGQSEEPSSATADDDSASSQP